MRKLVYYVATSADGLIAADDGDTTAFPADPATLRSLFDRYPETCPAHVRDVLGVTGAPRRFDAVIMGRATHQPAVDAGLADGAYPHLAQFVVTHHDLPASPSLTVVSGDVAGFVTDLKHQPCADIWLCGGADLAGQLVDHIDEVQLKVNPVLLGHGSGLLRHLEGPLPLELQSVEGLPGGVVLLTYRITH